MMYENIASMIDHTILKPDATREQVTKICEEAKQYGFASVCTNPIHVQVVAKLLEGTGVKACAVVGFPLGASTPSAKAFEAIEALASGASEIDMVMNIGMAKSGDWELVQTDIARVVEAVRGRAIVKVILETCLLTDEEKIRSCLAARKAGADFVKTSTGFSTGGATVEDVQLMRRTVGEKMGVKASGGIRDAQTTAKMIEAGANRIGTSSGVSIVQGTGTSGSSRGY